MRIAFATDTMALQLSKKTAFGPARAAKLQRVRVAPIRAAAVAGEVPDMGKRTTMNLILLGGISLPVGGLAVPYGEQWDSSRRSAIAARPSPSCPF